MRRLEPSKTEYYVVINRRFLVVMGLLVLMGLGLLFIAYSQGMRMAGV